MKQLCWERLRSGSGRWFACLSDVHNYRNCEVSLQNYRPLHIGLSLLGVLLDAARVGDFYFSHV